MHRPFHGSVPATHRSGEREANESGTLAASRGLCGKEILRIGKNRETEPVEYAAGTEGIAVVRKVIFLYPTMSKKKSTDR